MVLEKNLKKYNNDHHKVTEDEDIANAALGIWPHEYFEDLILKAFWALDLQL